MNQRGAGLKELLPTSNTEKPKHKPRRKPSGGSSPNPNPAGSPPRKSSGSTASSDEPTKHSRHHRSSHGSMDSNDQDPSVRRRRSVPNKEIANHLPDGSAPPRKATSRPRKLKGTVGGEASLKKSPKGKAENSADTCNDII